MFMKSIFSLWLKSCLTVFMLLFVGYRSFAGSYKEAVSKMMGYYNKAQYDSIYGSCNAAFKISISEDKINAFFKNLYNQDGAIKSFDSINFTVPATAIFLVNFEKKQLELHISLDAQNLISGLYFLPPKEIDNKPDADERINKTPLRLPFNSREKWYVFWGGSTIEQNYHNTVAQQKYAYDFIITDDEGLSHSGNGSRNEDYYAYDKQIFAAADGEVVEVIDGVLENDPGKMNPFNATGNSVVIKVADSEYITYAHFKTYSIKVKPGEKVKKGQLIGFCGNSGNSSEPHLHFQMQTTPIMANGIGIKTHFAKLILYKKVETGEVYDYSPLKGDKVSAVE